ncbi:MAG: DNA polymerase III subunit chi [Pseudomonadota bacterium]
MTDVLFYHLEHTTLDRVLPGLLEKSLERGWRAVVQASSDERVEALNQHLWTYHEQSFLPHGTSQDGHPPEQPIFLTTSDINPNNANIRFFVDGADKANISEYTRVVYLFDGHNEEAIALARQQWKTAKDAGHDATYWQQNAHGGWEKKA